MVERLSKPVTVAEIAARLGAKWAGDGTLRIDRLASLQGADAGSISFLVGRRHLAAARASAAGALMVSPAMQAEVAADVACVLLDDPYVGYAHISQWFEAMLRPIVCEARIHPSAHIDPTALLGSGVSVGAHASIGPRVLLADGVSVGDGCVIGSDVSLGQDSRLVANVSIYRGVRIGARALIHAGTVIGADGFGFAPSKSGFVKIAQLGSVVVGDDVEIGANCAIDRGALDDTVIGDGVKIDNLVQIAHNVRVGAHTAIAGCVGIAGSAVIGARCMIGGGVGVAGHVEICDGAVIGGFSLVERSVTEPGFYTGAWPLQAHTQWERSAATLKQLPQLRQRLRALASQVGVPKDPL